MQDTDNELLQTLLLGFDRAMLVSRRGNELHSRPMALAQTRDSSRLWLLSSAAGDRIEELADEPHVNVVLQDGLRFCSVSGTARVARHAVDRPVPGSALGAGRSSLLLVQVTPVFAEYWDRSGAPGLKFEALEGRASRERRISASPRREGEEAATKPLANVIPLERARWKK